MCLPILLLDMQISAFGGGSRFTGLTKGDWRTDVCCSHCSWGLIGLIQRTWSSSVTQAWDRASLWYCSRVNHTNRLLCFALGSSSSSSIIAARTTSCSHCSHRSCNLRPALRTFLKWRWVVFSPFFSWFSLALRFFYSLGMKWGSTLLTRWNRAQCSTWTLLS